MASGRHSVVAQGATSRGRTVKNRFCFRRERVPEVSDILTRLGLKLRQVKSAGYAQVRCSIHGEHRPSLSIHLTRGNWRCFACGETGGDALELYRLALGLTFFEAVGELGAWEEQKADVLTHIGKGRFVGVTSGCATSERGADWGLLEGRRVLLWPDNDDLHAYYANDVASVLRRWSSGKRGTALRAAYIA